MTRNNTLISTASRVIFRRPHSRRFFTPYDYTLLIIVGIVICIGLVMLTSATSILSLKETSGSYFFLKRQIVRGVLPGIIAMTIAMRINYRRYHKIASVFLLLTIVLLLLVFVPGLGLAQNGVKGWISLFGITIQTNEIAKLTFVIWLASWLAGREKEMQKFAKTSLPFFMALTCVSLLIALQPDTGTVLIFASTAFVMFYLARARILHVLLLTATGALLAIPFIMSARYKLLRLLTFLHPERDISGAGYQIRQALIALGAGSWWGMGIGRSVQKYQFLPEIESDSIFAIIGEELGFIVSALFILLFGYIFIRGFRIARNAPNNFGMLLASGLTLLITFQALINVAAMVGLLPLTGLPLPFVSLGGTNMIVLLTAVGILLNISSFKKKDA